MKRLLIIDAHSIIHRAYHALPPLNAPDGRPIQAVYGLARILLSFIDRAPDHIVAASDMKETTFRKAAYDQYKAHRAETPDDLAAQMDEAKELFRRLNIPFFEYGGVEADDIIATIVTKFSSTPDLHIEIMSSDSDLFQLVEDDHVVIQTFKKGVGDTIIYDEDAIRERYGLSPKQMIDYKALVGDTSDNVPGMPGIGPKTATTLLQEFHSIDGIYANLKNLLKHKEKFEKHRSQLDMGRMLITLKRDVPILLKSLDELASKPADAAALASYFQELGFASLVRQVQKRGGDKDAIGGDIPQQKRPKTTKGKKKPGALGTLFGSPSVVDAPERVANGAKIQDAVRADTSAPDDTIVVVDPRSLKENKDLVSTKTKVGFDLKATIQDLWDEGRDLAPPYADLGIAFWLLHPDLRNYEPEVIFGAVLKRPYHGTPDDIRSAYQEARRLLEKSGARRMYEELEMPILRMLAEMEHWGIYISEDKLKALEKEIREACDDLTGQIYKLAGGPFNLNSPKQVGEMLFDKLAIRSAGPKSSRKPASRSTRADILDELRDAHPIVPLLLKYREDFKILSTYVMPLQELRDQDGILHTEYLQTGTATGRISSRAPNLQNIPQGSAWSKPLRSAFEARPGHTFVAYDYSQLELRILAALADDPAMKKAFADGEDIHTLTASLVLGKPLKTVTKDERRIAKTLNFGLAYGMGIRAFTRESHLPAGQAKEFIDRYFERFGRVRAWQEETKEFARTHGYTETVTGRRRYFRGFQSYSRPHIVAEAERAAINHPVQGSEGDIVKLAMLKAKDLLVEKKLWGDGVRMLLNIHDELLFEVRDDMIDTSVSVLQEAMEGVLPSLGVPLRVDVHTGKDWGSMQHIDIK